MAIFRPLLDKIFSKTKSRPKKIEPILPEIEGPYPHILTRSQHGISRSEMSSNVIKVLYRLLNAGFEAYLVGGGVRDLLLKKRPKDFDVVSNATPEQVKRLFSNCRLIGRRFRLAHIYFGRDIIEVATFRGQSSDSAKEEDYRVKDGMIVRDNIYGSTIEEDAKRRDFTVNALYYNIKDFSLIDYVGGIPDLNKRVLRLIGEAHARYQEDPARVLRAARFAAKLDFEIEEKTRLAMADSKHLLEQVPKARLFEEIRKLFSEGAATQCFDLLLENHLLGEIFPQTYTCLLQEGGEGRTYRLLKLMFENADERVIQQKPVTPAFFFAILLWTGLQKQMEKLQRQGHKKWFAALEQASEDILHRQTESVMIPRHFQMRIKDIWGLQYHLINRRSQKIFDHLHHQSFRAAYDLLVLRHKAGEEGLATAEKWWTKLQEVDDAKKKQMVADLKKSE